MHKTADKRLDPRNYEWSVRAAGRHQMPFAAQVAIRGGNLRVGLEDSLSKGRGELATSNTRQMARIREIVEYIGLTFATPEEACALLALKSRDQVAF